MEIKYKTAGFINTCLLVSISLRLE